MSKLETAIKAVQLACRIAELTILIGIIAAGAFAYGHRASAVDAFTSIHKTSLQANALINDARASISEINKVTADERFYFEKSLPTTMSRVNTILDSTNDAVLSLKGTSDTATTQLAAISTAMRTTLTTLDTNETTITNDVTPVIANLTPVINHVDNLVSDPHVLSSLENIDVTSKALADATQQGDAILKDGRIVADKYVKPQSWYMKVIGYVFKGGELTYDFLR